MKLKFCKFVPLLLLVNLFLQSCGMHSKSFQRNLPNRYNTSYLLSIVNDTTLFDFEELKIVDTSIFPILDSVISLSQNCTYFDPNFRYLNTFRFSGRFIDGKELCAIEANLSPSEAIGLPLFNAGLKKEIKNLGVFFYKGYLFVVPFLFYEQYHQSGWLDFLIKTEKIVKLKAPAFFHEMPNSSYITFAKQGKGYKMIGNETCRQAIISR